MSVDRHIRLIQTLRHMRSLVDSIRHETACGLVSSEYATGINTRRWNTTVPRLVDLINDFRQTPQERVFRTYVVLMLIFQWRVNTTDMGDSISDDWSVLTAWNDVCLEMYDHAQAHLVHRGEHTDISDELRAQLDELDNLVICNDDEVRRRLTLVKLSLT